jgi:HEAT repeat protein
MDDTPRKFPDEQPIPLPRDLPPVEPPSAGFIVQLFVIPAVIVAVLIVVVALFGKLAEAKRDPASYVDAIRSGNPNVQWRAAYELAALIQNEPELARDPRLLGRLTALLDEDIVHAKPGDDPRVRRYLAAALGVFQTLDAQAPTGRVIDPLAILATASASAQPPKVRAAALESIARQGARLDGMLEDPATIKALGEAASDESQPPAMEDDDPTSADLRQRAVYALGFCTGNPARDILRDRVTHDPDRFVRYNAAIALARRGDLVALDALHEMLSTADLTTLVKAGHDAHTRNRVESIQDQALRALQAAVKDHKPHLAENLRPEISALVHSTSVEVRLDAETLLKSLQTSR